MQKKIINIYSVKKTLYKWQWKLQINVYQKLTIIVLSTICNKKATEPVLRSTIIRAFVQFCFFLFNNYRRIKSIEINNIKNRKYFIWIVVVDDDNKFNFILRCWYSSINIDCCCWIIELSYNANVTLRYWSPWNFEYGKK